MLNYLIYTLALIGAFTVRRWIVNLFDTSGNSGRGKHWAEE